MLQNFCVLNFCADKFSYKWTYSTKNCRSTIIVSVWVLVRRLLFCLARNRDSEAILIPIIIIDVTLSLSGVVVDWTLLCNLAIAQVLPRVIASECSRRDKGSLELERPFLSFKYIIQNQHSFSLFHSRSSPPAI